MAVSETSTTGNGRDRATSRRAKPSTSAPEPPSGAEGGALGAAAQAAEVLAPETGLAGLDPVSFSKAVARFGTEVARRPVPTLRALTRYGAGLGVSGLASVGRAVGMKMPGAVPPPAKDKRFTDPAWEQNAGFFGVLQAYRVFERLIDDLLELAELGEPWAGKARFALRGIADALAPTNFLAGNPAALKRAFDTGGLSLVKGFQNWWTDFTTNGGLPRKVDRSAFVLGKNLAATPGKVVFRNDLMELLQYSPTTPTVHAVPLLMSPPWINKYYVMDLAPGRSFAEWAVKHGHTVFQISYRNPDKTMGDTRLDDYL